jgi:two-component sensor histidine kinase
MPISGERPDGAGPASYKPIGMRPRRPSAETARLQALVERQAMQMREIDHRAKNSLQLAASMLLLQARSRPANPARPDLERAVERLQVLAEVHRASYLALEDDRIEVRPWITRLCLGLAFQPGVELRIDCPDTTWPFAIVAPLGLFTGEALANACKHAFPDGRGRVDVRISELEPGAFRLSIADDGQGLPPQVAEGLGSRLLSSFAAQLGGSIRRSSGPDGQGLVIELDFCSG